MGGSGSGPSSSYNFDSTAARKDMRQEMVKLEADLERQKLEVEVAEVLSEALSEMNARDTEANNRTLETIKKALEKEIDGSIDLMFGGSVKKHTYVDGLSDIDTLVILNKSEMALNTPQEARVYFAERLKERFPNAAVIVGRLAVTIRFQNKDIQLLPALRHGDGLKIPKADGEGWSKIRELYTTLPLTINLAIRIFRNRINYQVVHHLDHAIRNNESPTDHGVSIIEADSDDRGWKRVISKGIYQISDRPLFRRRRNGLQFLIGGQC